MPSRRLRTTDALGRLVARDPAVRRMRSLAADEGARLLLVGGYLRDALLGRAVRDTDFILDGPPRGFVQAIARRLGRRVVTFRKRGIVDHRLLWQDREFDFVELGRRPLRRELARRDFTLNTLAFDLDEGRLVDPLNGREDLRRGLIRATSRRALDDDPLRRLRGVRLAAEIPALHIERRTLGWIADGAAALARSAPERIRHEMDRILAASRPGRHLALMERLGLLRAVLPELDPLRGLEQNRYHHLDAFEHTLAAVAAADRPGLLHRGLRLDPAPEAGDLVDLRWALLLHDLGKAEARERGPDGEWRFHNHHLISERQAVAVLRRLRVSRRRATRIRRLVREHLRIALPPGGTLSPRAMRRIIRDLAEDTPLLVLHALADKAATRGRDHARVRPLLREACRALLATYREHAEALLAPPRLVDGRDVMKVTGIPAGPEVGRLLAEIRDHQLDEAITTRRQALDYLRRSRS